MAKQILVTGGTGYIGSHSVVELQQNGYDVIIVDDLSNSSAQVAEYIEEITGKSPILETFNLTDRARTEQLFDKYQQIEGIIHFAASKAVGESVEKPLLYYHNNINSLLNLLFCMEKYQVNNLIFSSSCTVYGQPEHLPVTEDTPRKEAESPYGNTKAICEDIIRDFIKAHPTMKAIALRYFNPIGAHPSALIGEKPSGTPNNLVPYITQTAAGIRKELSIFGDDYNTPDGTCIRDYIHVVDLAKAHVLALDRILNHDNKDNYEFFNVGTGRGYSVMQLVKTFIAVNQVDLPYKIVSRRSGDIEKIYADTTRANKALNWHAESSLEETLASAWAWEKQLLQRKQ